MPTTRPRAVPLPLATAAPPSRALAPCSSRPPAAAAPRASAPGPRAAAPSAAAATPAAPTPAAAPTATAAGAPAAAAAAATPAAPAASSSRSAAPASAAPPGRAAPLPTARPHDIPRLATSAADLLDLARHGLAEAALATTPHDRYAAAHLSALRAAAAVIAARARPTAPAPTRRTRPLSAWVLLATVAPELGEWAAFFASGARKRAAAEAHLPGAVNAREADDLLRDAETFLAVIETKLGGAARPSLLDRGVG